MLRSDRSCDKNQLESKASFLSFPWTDNRVRFSNTDKLVDVLDAFGTLYGSVSSATSAQTRWFKYGENTEKTAEIIGRMDCNFVYKIKWEGDVRRRLAIKSDDMHTFLTKCIPKLRHSEELASAIALQMDLKDATPAHTNKRGREDDHPGAQTLSDRVVIYRLVLNGTPVYTGRTNNAKRRLQEHASRHSGCRLVRNAFKKHGRKSFAIEPIVWCSPEDADANESYYIEKNCTMYPRGYNLRHGSTAGDEPEQNTRIVEATGTNIVPFAGDIDEAKAYTDAWNDMIQILQTGGGDDSDEEADVDAQNQVEALRGRVDAAYYDHIRLVHPDRAGPAVFSAAEVSAMLNAVRSAVQ